MKNKIISLLILLLLFILFLLIISYSEVVMEAVTFSISIWKDSLIPAMFPFFIISEIMVNYGFIELMGGVFERFMNKLFYLPGEASFAVFGSMVSGFPSASKYIVNLLDSGLIDEENANYLMTFTHFSNPLFIIGSVGVMMLNNKEIGFLILVVHFFTNFILAFIFRKKRNIIGSKKHLRVIVNNVYNKRKESKNFIIVLSNAIFNSFKILLLILGIITIFLMITSILSSILSLNSFSNGILSGILEMTQGVKNVSMLQIPLYLKATLITFFVSFGGLSIHFQVLSIIQDKNIKYKYFLLARFIHALISGFLVFVILYFNLVL